MRRRTSWTPEPLMEGLKIRYGIRSDGSAGRPSSCATLAMATCSHSRTCCIIPSTSANALHSCGGISVPRSTCRWSSSRNQSTRPGSHSHRATFDSSTVSHESRETPACSIASFIFETGSTPRMSASSAANPKATGGLAPSCTTRRIGLSFNCTCGGSPSIALFASPRCSSSSRKRVTSVLHCRSELISRARSLCILFTILTVWDVFVAILFFLSQSTLSPDATVIIFAAFSMHW
mmetsp:Transcript_15966/g.34649  ORF Transcript_15966/g.34649 Transcript_15966/m.34649 type:complete len:235 (-) Transcript_15966:866-1570(-)